MLAMTTGPAPGLSAVGDDLPVGPGDLGTTRYRHWVELRGHLRELLGRPDGRPLVRRRRTASRWSRISVPSRASGTLSRLP